MAGMRVVKGRVVGNAVVVDSLVERLGQENEDKDGWDVS
jgi:hypothetical protein